MTQKTNRIVQKDKNKDDSHHLVMGIILNFVRREQTTIANLSKKDEKDYIVTTFCCGYDRNSQDKEEASC